VSDGDRRARLDAALAHVSEAGDALVCVVGPTASGKTDLAVDLACALGGEIVSADSVQVYRRFDAASGKPSEEERTLARHHLVDVADGLEPFDAARFVVLADAAIADIRARGRRPIVCGGTFLWVKALLSGLSAAPPGDPEIRARHAVLVAERGREALHARLREIDPRMAERLHPNDVLRVGRALEVFEVSGRRLSELQEAHGFREARYPSLLLTVARSQDELTERLRVRVRGFVASGLVAEVEGLVADGYREARAMGSVGYKEALAVLEGRLPEAELEDSIVRASRVFARRQRTWLGHEPVISLGRRQ
jgi:tRNA dimethylallyltransferase